MAFRIGLDLENSKRFRKHSKGSTFVRRYFSAREADYCFSKPYPHLHLAARFAAKEAYFKASNRPLQYSDVELLNSPRGKPYIAVNGRRPKRVEVTVSHSGNYAAAVVAIQ